MSYMNTAPFLAKLGISRLSDMQANVIETIRTNQNVVLLAPTGTGKTLAFLLPLIEKINVKDDALQAIVLSPTRELANQTFQVLQTMKSPVRVACVHGGRPAMDEHRVIKSLQPHVIIGTPGRIIDHLGKGNFLPDNVKSLVIDEFDKMLELKFQDEILTIEKELFAVSDNVLVSATDSSEISLFAAFNKRHHVRLNYLGQNEAALPNTIKHYVVHSPQKDKLETLRNLLSTFKGEPAVVFVGYRESVERTGQSLKQQGFACSLFHGGLEQDDREKALYMFSGGSVNVFVSTDLSARGLDIRTLRHVVHYHLPLRKEEYMHRCGRTGRWEDEGSSYIILGPEENLPDYADIDFALYELNPPYEAPQAPAYSTIYIGKGKRDKISKGDVVGFLCKQGGAKSDDIGRIDVRERYTYVSINRSRCRQILNQCAGEKIKKMSTRIELMK